METRHLDKLFREVRKQLNHKYKAIRMSTLYKDESFVLTFYFASGEVSNTYYYDTLPYFTYEQMLEKILLQMVQSISEKEFDIRHIRKEEDLCYAYEKEWY